jgi:hypothetical protein
MRSWMKRGRGAALLVATLWLVTCASDRDNQDGTATNAISPTTTGGVPAVIANPLPLDASTGGSANLPTAVAY